MCTVPSLPLLVSVINCTWNLSPSLRPSPDFGEKLKLETRLIKVAGSENLKIFTYLIFSDPLRFHSDIRIYTGIFFLSQIAVVGSL